ncbi:uncharacterized protein LOC122537351 isoform X1 [Frieseomelitta varia]|uniref:uncharacterized protein LOC122537351 isoform X1 n=1 Tax=Frieseomelitta varia TaxID=561572 RepID=UPI001CB68553|nr:uncharacterized protein LOC122537351 isoform X1 [Frieseomelitta varia]
MWTIFVQVLFVIASFDINFARSLNAESSLRLSDPTVSRLRNVEDIPARLPRKFRGNSRTRRLHIENQHGFDGKVEKIHINSEEDLPGIRAYGMQKKNLKNNGYIERTIQEDIMKEVDDASRAARSIEAYGKMKDHLEMNGHIERGNLQESPASYQSSRNEKPRIIRSIEAEAKQDNLKDGLEDLEAQDAKVFRPLFVYRQQMARRKHYGRNHIHSSLAGRKSCHD